MCPDLYSGPQRGNLTDVIPWGVELGFYDYLLLGGAAAALLFGALRFPRLISYLILVIVAALPVYNLSTKYGLTMLTGPLMVAIFFAIFAGLYWLGGKFAVGRSGRAPENRD